MRTRNVREDIGPIVVYQESAVPYFCLRPRQVARLRAAFPGTRVVWCRTERAFVRNLPTVRVAVTWAFRQAWFEAAPQLRVVISSAAGRDLSPLTPPPRVTVWHGTFHGALMAETVLGWMLAFNRGILSAYRYQIQGALWPREALYGQVRLLHGTHALIVGFGHIGTAIGRLLKPFGVRVTGVRRTPQTRLPAGFGPEDAVVPIGQLDALLPEADHLILVLPSDTGTDRLINAARLARLPRHAVLYNVGRGNCLDEAALARALTTGRLRGACLDVFAEEPLQPGSPLVADLPGLVRLPHASAFADEYMERFTDEVIARLAARSRRRTRSARAAREGAE
ncbi:MAG TPA: NAD(P)-dependent oxidoreductase [Kiritimatiellia bacterium]|jgi:phosphoglycerate dehydrogenase-like enzyme|nr:NAD(P)-dependent oxidoreductase [Kiritimatiellia bacterium]HOM58320.1 NAD(P)-dependent oxidoreductase [Kiritimatiellia bacterium]HOR97801.1 NAD(P)-dependent oxidoreductase [Kiritimatiellia bacterium]HPK37042.1 NAD(P)-dependent oxidoreductase [Kiritimatiellia bacterium]HPW75235.1 NAD(P)-dependent oxidoreductase [Kiritimatiellia bacterium]